VAEASTATSTETAAGAAPAKSAPAKSAPAKAAAGKVPTKATGGGAGGAGGAGKVPTKATAGGAGAGAAAGTGAAAAAAAPAGRRLSPPTVATVGQTQVHPDGAFYWLVRMTAGETVTDDSWIVQHVLMSGDGEADEFWEAFGVPANGTAVTGDDVFEELLDDAAGTRRVTGTMRHYVFPGGIDPPGMSAAGGGHGARGQLTTRTPPDWWTGAGGVAHELTFTWDGATTANLLTVPTSGDPVVKAVRTTVGQL
jgi:hypothetical protein